MVLGMFLSLLSTVLYGMLFNLPVRTLLVTGMVGMFGWTILSLISMYGTTIALATFVAATFISLASQVLSIQLCVPSTNFSVAGIIPLVPGSLAYKAMLGFVTGDNVQGLTLAVDTCMAAGAIAAGLISGQSLLTVGKGLVKRYARKGAKSH